jgi:hypothetical protein
MEGMQVDNGNARSLEPVTERIIVRAFRAANARDHGKSATSPPNPDRQHHPLYRPSSPSSAL